MPEPSQIQDIASTQSVPRTTINAAFAIVRALLPSSSEKTVLSSLVAGGALLASGGVTIPKNQFFSVGGSKFYDDGSVHFDANGTTALSFSGWQYVGLPGVSMYSNQWDMNASINSSKPASFNSSNGSYPALYLFGASNQTNPLIKLAQLSSTGTGRDAGSITAKVTTPSDASFSTDLVFGISRNANMAVVSRFRGIDYNDNWLILGNEVNSPVLRGVNNILEARLLDGSSCYFSASGYFLGGGLFVVLNGAALQLGNSGSYASTEIYSGTTRVLNAASGRAITAVPNAAPSDGLIGQNEMTFYLDEESNKLKVRCRYSDGTYKTGEIALA